MICLKKKLEVRESILLRYNRKTLRSLKLFLFFHLLVMSLKKNLLGVGVVSIEGRRLPELAVTKNVPNVHFQCIRSWQRQNEFWLDTRYWKILRMSLFADVEWEILLTDREKPFGATFHYLGCFSLWVCSNFEVNIRANWRSQIYHLFKSVLSVTHDMMENRTYTLETWSSCASSVRPAHRLLSGFDAL